MTGKPPSRKPLPTAEAGGELISDAEIEHFLERHHRDIAGKLAAARNSIAAGNTAPLEPLRTLLRVARRSAKTVR